MKRGRRQKSQCEAGALDISALGAGPEVGNTIVLHGSASSLVCGGGGGGGGMGGLGVITQIWIKQLILSV